MNVSRTAALALFKALNYHGVKETTQDKVLEIKLNRLKSLVEDMDEQVFSAMDDEEKGLLEDIVSDLSAGKAIKVVADDEEDDPEEAPKPKPAKEKKGKGKKPPAKEEEEEEDEEPEEETEEVEVPKAKVAVKEKPKAKPAPAAGARSFERVGIVGFIEEIIKGTSKTKPVTKQEALERLEKKFPDRPVKGMKHTLDVQLNYPDYSSLMKRGLNIVKTPDGYYLAKPAGPAVTKEVVPAKAKPAKAGANGAAKPAAKEKPKAKAAAKSKK